MITDSLEEVRRRTADAMQGFSSAQPPEVCKERLIQSLIAVVADRVRSIAATHVRIVGHGGNARVEIDPPLQVLLLAVSHPTLLQNGHVQDVAFLDGWKVATQSIEQCDFVDDDYTEKPKQRPVPKTPDPEPEVYIRPKKRPSSMLPWQK